MPQHAQRGSDSSEDDEPALATVEDARQPQSEPEPEPEPEQQPELRREPQPQSDSSDSSEDEDGASPPRPSRTSTEPEPEPEPEPEQQPLGDSDSSEDEGAALPEGVPTPAGQRPAVAALAERRAALDAMLDDVADAVVDLAPAAALAELKQAVGQLEQDVERLTPREEGKEDGPAAAAQPSLIELERQLSKARQATHKHDLARQSAAFEAAQAIRTEQRVLKQEQAALQRAEVAHGYKSKLKAMKERQKFDEDRRLKKDLLPDRLASAEHRRTLRASKATRSKEEWERDRRLELEAELALHAKRVQPEEPSPRRRHVAARKTKAGKAAKAVKAGKAGEAS